MHVPNGKSFLAGFMACLLIVLAGCAWGYRSYYLRMATYDGKLIADRVENDLPLTFCTPTQVDKNPCVVMFREEFYKLKRTYERMRIELNDCQKNQ